MADLPARKDLHVHLRNLANTIKWMGWFDRPVLNAKAIMSDDFCGTVCNLFCTLAFALVCTPAGAFGTIVCGLVGWTICWRFCEPINCDINKESHCTSEEECQLGP